MTGSEGAPGPAGPSRTATVRPGCSEDLDAVAEVHLRAREHAGMPSPGEPDEVLGWVRGWDLDEDDLWVAQLDGLVVGYARLRGAWMDDLYVDPGHQGAGVGSLLLEVVCALRPHGFGLWVFVDNTRARGFYAARGLVELEHTDGSGNREHVPDVRLVWPGEQPLRYLREAIDDVDDELALLLARRTALASAVQDLKVAQGGVGGHAGRDVEREAQIVARMAPLAPSLAPDLLARVQHVVLEVGLDGWERTRSV